MHKQTPREITELRAELLIKEADELMRTGKVDPFFAAVEVLGAWRRASAAHLARLAVLARLPPPNEAVTLAFFKILTDRAELRRAAYAAIAS
jgi:hypothetical protein